MRGHTTLAAVVALAAALAAMLAVGAAGASAPGARYLLTPRDVGTGYKRNPSTSGSRTLADLVVGDSQRVRSELRSGWIGGSVAGYNSISGTGGVISIVDVFRPRAAVGDVLAAWQEDAVRITHGTREPLPAHAPGSHAAIVRGSVLQWEVLVYMWSRGHSIASVEVTGKPGAPKRTFLLALVRRQDAKLLAS